MKICTRCKQNKKHDSFSRNKSTKDKLNVWCKECSNEVYHNNKWKYRKRIKEYTKNNKEKLSEYRKKYYLKKKEITKQSKEEYYKNPENRKKLLLIYAKKNAKDRKFDFNLDIGDIIIPEYCPYLDIKLTHSLGKGLVPTNSSIDRIDSTKGYIKGNVQVISRLANIMKSNATKKELITFANNILHLCQG